MKPDDFTNEAPGQLVVAPEGHSAYVPNPLPPEYEMNRHTIGLLADAERALGELKGVGWSLPYPYLLISPFLRREAVLSSRIEGTTAGLQQLLLFEAAPTDAPEEPDVREVANYVAALELGFSLLERMPICLRLVRDVHARLMDGVRGQEQRPGEFRNMPNLIGYRGATPETARFVPPPVMEMGESLNLLEKYIGERRDDLPFLVQLALVHYQFETIHPFMDGNGRMGRLLIALQLREREYLPQPMLYLSAYFEQNREAYRDHLFNVSRAGEWTGWIDFFLQGLAEQSHDTTQRSHRLIELMGEYQQWALSASRTGNLAKLSNLIFAHPILSIANVQEWLEVTQPAASRLVQQLTDRGILVEITGRQRDRRFAAMAILEIVNPPDE